MKKLTLDIGYNFDFALVGITSHIKDYKISWLLNNNLKFNFIKIMDYLISNETKKQTKKENFLFDKKEDASLNSSINGFSQYYYQIEENHVSYFLISNKSENGLLIPELPIVDYFILIQGPITENEIEKFITSIREIPDISTVYKVDVSKLKSKNNLII